MSFPPAPPESSPRRRSWPLVLVMIAVVLLGAGAGAYGLGRMLLDYEPYALPSEHMSPTLEPGDQLVVRRADGTEVHRGDLVAIEAGAFAADEQPGVSVFRVVGVAGDTVACCTDGHLSVNGKPVTEPYIAPGYEGLFEFSAKVPEGSIFVEGDNRGNSDDSRFRGPVPLSGVTGFVVATGTVVTPNSLTAVTAFTDAGLPGAPFTDSALATLRWWVVAGAVVFFAGLIGLVVTLVRSAGRRRKAAASPPAH